MLSIVFAAARSLVGGAGMAVLASTAMAAGSEAVQAVAPAVPSEVSLDAKWDFAILDEKYDLGSFQQQPSSTQKQLSITVPSNWYLTGIDHAGAAFYRRNFTVPRERSGQRITLEFGGVDYQATVWVNGAICGQHTGYFAEFSFDITDKVRFGDDNVVSVLVNSPREDSASWSQWKRLIKGVLAHHDTRPGGAWSENGQDANTGGIWAPVQLRYTGATRISSIQVTPQVLETGLTRAVVNLSLDSHGSEKTQFQIKTVLTPANFTGAAIERTFNVDRPHDGMIELSLPAHNGALWWPKQLGRPNLYKLDIEIWQGSTMSDRRTERFGYRTVDFDPESGQWRVNGKRIFLKGTNYIPTQWLSEMTKASYVRDIKLMQEAYINAVRVHAVIVSKPFYEAADEAGILVWQDFPLQWGYTDEPKFQTEAVRQAGEMVRTLFNHPAIIAWSMQNEPPWDAWWMKYKYPGYNPDQNRELTAALADAVRTLDPTRHTHKYSATAEHTWQGWYSGHWRDFEKPTKQVLIAEYGAQALPNLESLKRIFGVGALLWPDTDAKMDIWRYHNFQPDETFKNAGIARGDNIGEFIANSQSYQSNLIRVAAESYRRQKYGPVGGIFQFMFVEDWPSVNWGVVDYWRNTKPGYLALKQAYQPVLVSLAGLESEMHSGAGGTYPVWVVNDLDDVLSGCELKISLVREQKTIAASRYIFSIDADKAQHIIDWSLPILSPGPMTLTASVVRAGKTIGLNRLEIVVHD